MTYQQILQKGWHVGHFQIYATRNVTSLESREHDQMVMFMRLTGYLKYLHPAQGLHVGTIRFTEHISTPTGNKGKMTALEYVKLSSIKCLQINVNSKQE